MYITRALIGRNPCLDQAIQTRKTIVLLLFYKTITLWFPCLDGLIQTLGNVANTRKITRLRLVFRALFLTLATFPRVWIRPSKHGNHKVIVYSSVFLRKAMVLNRIYIQKSSFKNTFSTLLCKPKQNTKDQDNYSNSIGML